MGVQVWKYGTKIFNSVDAVSSALREELDKLKTPGDVTSWMDLVRVARHPQTLWSIDYICGVSALAEANQLIKESEILLYGDDESLTLKDGYSADIYQEITFHTVRAHLRAEEGKISTCIKMFEQMLEKYYDDLSVIRKSNLLMHAILCFLCCKKWDESFQLLQRHWNLLKYSTPQDRDALGIWDNEVILRSIYWFFIGNCMDFRNFYSSKMELPSSQVLWKHKKIGFLHLLEYDNSWVVSFCSLALYNHARTLMPLPEYAIKHTTPINDIYTTPGNVHLAQPGKEEQKYLNRFQALLCKDYEHANFQDSIHLAEVKDALFSYAHFGRNKTKERNIVTTLSMFINDKTGHNVLEKSKSIIDAGCGTMLYDLGIRDFSGEYAGVDVSEAVIKILTKSAASTKSAAYKHAEINTYLDKTQEFFELCWCCGTLTEMTESEIERFLHLAAQKTKILATAVELNDDWLEIEGIGDWIQAAAEKKGIEIPSKLINLHRTVWSASRWEKQVGKYFDIQTLTDTNCLYIYGVSKK